MSNLAAASDAAAGASCASAGVAAAVIIAARIDALPALPCTRLNSSPPSPASPRIGSQPKRRCLDLCDGVVTLLLHRNAAVVAAGFREALE